MTNFEALAKSDRLASYIAGLFSQVNPHKDGLTDFAILCANWLQAERTAKQYVALEDVFSILNKPFLVNDLQSFVEQYRERLEEIKKLETKEIDE